MVELPPDPDEPPSIRALALAVALGGAAGSVARALTEATLPLFDPRGPLTQQVPWCALVVNGIGALALGACGARLGDPAPQRSLRRSAVATGFFGGYTTFSALAWATWSLTRSGGDVALAVLGAATLLGLAAAPVGAWLGERAARRAVDRGWSRGPVDPVTAAALLLPLLAILALALSPGAAALPSLQVVLLVVAGGAVGALLRGAVSVLATRIGLERPHGTLAVNLAASLAIGLVLGRPGVERTDPLVVLLVPGVLGALSTFSALAVESMARVREGRATTAAQEVLLSFAAGPLLVGLGARLAGA